METCRIEACEKPIYVKKVGLCTTHYGRFHKHGDPEAWKKPTRAVCNLDGCDLAAIGNGLCSKHYTRQRRYGTTDMPERPTVCAIDGCGDPVAAKALCDRHYRRKSRGVVGTDRRCLWCGKSVDTKAHANRRFCNKECKEREEFVRRQESHRGRWLKLYNLDPERFDAMLAEQGGGCKICGTTKIPQRGSFCVDHDHACCPGSGSCGKCVRGLLCTECNNGLGKFQDDPALLRRAAEYLERAGVVTS